jgi:hypothetical protein
MTAADVLGVGGLADDDLYFRSLLAQYTGDASQSAARAVAGDEVVEALALEVGEDLARRGDLMLSRRWPPSRTPGRRANRSPRRARRPCGIESLLCARHEHRLGAEHAHQLALDREAVRHGQDQRITVLRARRVADRPAFSQREEFTRSRSLFSAVGNPAREARRHPNVPSDMIPKSVT